MEVINTHYFNIEQCNMMMGWSLAQSKQMKDAARHLAAFKAQEWGALTFH
jgi:hypothetical protein